MTSVFSWQNSVNLLHFILRGQICLLFRVYGATNPYSIRWPSRSSCAHLLWELQNYNSLLSSCWLKKCWIPPKHNTHIQRQRRSPRKMVGGVKLCLESNSLPTRDAQRIQTNLMCTRTQRPHRDWTRTVSECLLWRCISAVACHRGRGSGCSWPGYGISSLGGGSY